MPGKISDLTTLATPAADDLVEVVDVSDLSMAATGTNKKTPFSAFGDTPWVTPSMTDQPYQWIPAIGGYSTQGLPGRSLRQGGVDANSRYVQNGWRYLYPFYVNASLSFGHYYLGVFSGEAPARCDLAIYSVPDWKVNRTATLVTGTKVTGVDVSGGQVAKYIAFGPVVLAAGHYWLGHVSYGGSPGSMQYDYALDCGSFFASGFASGASSGAYNDDRTTASGLPAGNFTVLDTGYTNSSIWAMLVKTIGA